MFYLTLKKQILKTDKIARGLSPFNPDKSLFQAGRLMLERIKYLKSSGKDFAFETTLSTRSYKGFIEEAQKEGYEVTLLFFYLNSVELAIKRVATRVIEGGHNIPEDIIRRRYEKGLENFFGIFKPIVNSWTLVDNSERNLQIIAERKNSYQESINQEIWEYLKRKYHG